MAIWREARPGAVHDGRSVGVCDDGLGFRSGIDYAQLLRTADIFWSEEPSQASWTTDGRLVSKIRSFKVARSLDRSLFIYTGGRYGAQSADSPPELRIAEAMASNGVK